MDVNELCDQKLVDSVFMPIKKKFPTLEKDIEQIEFTFKNSCYNKNRLIEDINRSRNGFEFPDDDTALKIANSMGLKKSKTKFEMHIPLTLWADIIIFELNAFSTNVIRTANFLLRFKLKHWDAKSYSSYPSVGQYFNDISKKKRIYEKEVFYKEFKHHYDNWIKDINKLRNKIIHGYIIREMQSQLIIRYRRIDETEVKTEGDQTITIPQYEILNIETYVTERTELLRNLIDEFFREFSRSGTVRQK